MVEENRATGKTTRVIDNAIQAFFNNGEKLYIPTYHQLKDREEGTNLAANNPIPDDLNEDQIIIDPDWRVSTAVQRGLVGKILQRLNFEHMGMARKYKIVKSQYITNMNNEETE